jgi:hypothetical protein
MFYVLCFVFYVLCFVFYVLCFGDGEVSPFTELCFMSQNYKVFNKKWFFCGFFVLLKKSSYLCV